MHGIGHYQTLWRMFTLNVVESLIYGIVFTLNMVEELKKLKGYRQVSLPDALYEEIKANLGRSGSFTSVADFVKYAVRRELEKGVIE